MPQLKLPCVVIVQLFSDDLSRGYHSGADYVAVTAADKNCWPLCAVLNYELLSPGVVPGTHSVRFIMQSLPEPDLAVLPPADLLAVGLGGNTEKGSGLELLFLKPY